MQDNDPEQLAELITPRQAVQQFFNAKRGTIKDSSLRSYKYPTKHFVEYCEEHGIETVSEINGHVLESWKEQRRREDIKLITVHNNAKHLRVFVKYLERRELLDQGTHQLMDVPTVPEEQAVSSDTLRLDQAEQTLRYLNTYEYGSRHHALFKTLWHTGCRISGALALDVSDFVTNSTEPILKFRNRKATGTPLKNGNKSERNVSIDDSLVQVLTDYLSIDRDDVEDDFNRQPLFTTSAGRLRRQVAYDSLVPRTRPCKTVGKCPHNRQEEHCEAAQDVEKAPSCPSTVSLHPIRRGSITYHIDRGWPKETLSERVDVSIDVLEKHYDARTHEQKRQKRKEYLDLL
ncbi:MAG: tyrosine-type recombinase/integrase [Halorhabdus sp.]